MIASVDSGRSTLFFFFSFKKKEKRTTRDENTVTS
jgi:hypothetical protein